jgi:hypothetical protein
MTLLSSVCLEEERIKSSSKQTMLTCAALIYRLKLTAITTLLLRVASWICVQKRSQALLNQDKCRVRDHDRNDEGLSIRLRDAS